VERELVRLIEVFFVAGVFWGGGSQEGCSERAFSFLGNRRGKRVSIEFGSGPIGSLYYGLRLHTQHCIQHTAYRERAYIRD